MFQQMVQENCDVWVIAGDHSGSSLGYKGTKAIFSMAREHFKGPILACLGNHDYWVRGAKKRGSERSFLNVGIYSHSYHHPSLASWLDNYIRIVEVAKEHSIHLFEEDGLFRIGNSSNYTFAGHGLWYKHVPSSNDHYYMPIAVEGDTHRHMYKKTTDALMKQLEGLDDINDGTRIFVSHFPVIELNTVDLPWSGDPFLGSMLRDDLRFTTFLNGHSHGNLNGPIRWECGSEYYQPKYKVIVV